MHHLMSKEITVNTEVILARRAFIAAAYAHSLGEILSDLPLLLRRYRGKRYATGETGCAAGSTLPRDLSPVH
jgi:hypothetical protein